MAQQFYEPPHNPEPWFRRIFTAQNIGILLALVSAIAAIFALWFDFGSIVVTLPGGNIENHTERNVVVFTNSKQTNLTDIPILPEIHNPSNRTVNDFSLHYTVSPIASQSLGLDISQSNMFSVNGNSSKLQYTYLQDNIKAFDKTGSPFSLMLPKDSYSASRIDIFCSHKRIKEPFLHGINLYVHTQAGSGSAWESACRKIYESKYSGKGFEICYVEGGRFSYTKHGETVTGDLTEENTDHIGDIEKPKTPTPAGPTKQHEDKPKQAPAVKDAVEQQTATAPAPADVPYEFNNPDVTFTFKKCACAGGTAYIDIIILNNSGSTLQASALSQEPCAGYENWNTMLYDDEGNSYPVARLKIGSSDRAIGSNYPFSLPDGVPVKARIYVSGVTNTAQTFSLLKMTFRNMDTAEPYGAGLLQMRNIPISRGR